MNLKNLFRKDILDHSGKLVKAATLPFLPWIIIVGQIFVLWISRQEAHFPEQDALMNIISCFAQIIAGLYGITLAGYTFFLSRIDALTAADATLSCIAESVKQRFKHLIWYITANVAVTLFISVFLMYYPLSSGIIPDYLYRVICNEFVLFLVFSTALILYHSVGVVDPMCLKKEAERLKKKLGGRIVVPGSAVEYISLYDRIEAQCRGLLPENVVNQIQENKGRQLEYILALLQEQGILPYPLITDLRRIHQYYECVINSGSFRVSQQMCALARKVLLFLDQFSCKLPPAM